ncbi:uncharacterized protein LOC103518796 [Diaphorina citri]|uniref:Uncharacterized protein LOC103518796 n=1 Tax=Diaphorina citri TaxID=121845 RepID=A0A1S3DHX4_DIACI|nr:uncharacterized protein LOC103518796 [Diaphorina citri]
MARRQEVIANKLALLEIIKEKKATLFGALSPTLTARDKEEAWKEVLLKAKSLKLAAAEKTWTYARDSLWSAWKSKTLGKRDNARSTGTGGGRGMVMDAVDQVILDILERTSPTVQGLEIVESYGSPPHLTSYEPETEDVDDPQPSTSSTPIPPPSKRRRSSSSLKEPHSELLDLEKKRIEQQLRLGKLEEYKYTLECVKLEMELGLPPSDFTGAIRQRIDAPPSTNMEDNEYENMIVIHDVDEM